MALVLGIESTAHTFGVGVVRDGKILANVHDMYTTENGGIIPIDSAKHHVQVKKKVYENALKEAGVGEEDIDAIAFSQGPGLAPCLLEGMRFTKELVEKFSLRYSRPTQPLESRYHYPTRPPKICRFPITSPTPRLPSQLKLSSQKSSVNNSEKVRAVPVNHCIAHLEIGKLTGAKDPVMLYVSGANTQIIAYSSGKYRIFGETLDIGVGNFIDNFARLIGIGFPGGPKIEKLAKEGKNYIELPYTVKGMDVALSGILTNLKQKLGSLSFTMDNSATDFVKSLRKNSINEKSFSVDNSKNNRTTLGRDNFSYTPADLAYSMQETVFAMLVETAERALAHTGKTELLLGGGVACNSRLQEMCRIMCKERGAKFFCPEKSLLVDNGAMIGFLGEIMFEKGIGETDVDKIDIMPRQRTDDVEVRWKN